MTDNIYKGKANRAEYDEYIDFINYVHGMNGHDISFLKLLPKLYKPAYDPCGASFIVKVDDKIRAGVGVFPMTLSVAGMQLKAYGIGNVAVHPNSRSKGYFKDIMWMALDEMRSKNVDFTVLSGLRQRYNYFTYEICGQNVCYDVSTTNIRHKYGGGIVSKLTLSLLAADDIDNLKKIHTLLNEASFHSTRDFEALYDILCTWQSIPYVAYDKDKFAGYVVFSQDKKTVHEFKTVSDEYIDDLIMASLEISGSEQVSFSFPPFDAEYIKAFSAIAERCSIMSAENFSVLNYKCVIEAFLKLKASLRPLCDGSTVMLIHGMQRDEQLKITFCNGEVSVINTNEDVDIELSHLEAMELLFCTVSPLRIMLPPIPASWLPLPIYNYSLDNV
jgi:hypothetical protein